VEPPPEDEDSLRVANGSDDGRPKRDEHEDDERVSSEGSGLSDDEAELNIPSDESGLTLSEFIEHVRVKGRRGLYEEYGEIKNRPPTGTFNHARAFENQVKNRYTDVLCYDHSRVMLTNSLDGSDYINANFVDGYKQPRAFISSQGPLPRTFPDFWQMVWEQHSLVIVMTTKTIERHRTKCGQYWPEDCGASLSAGPFEIHSDEMENVEDFIVTHLSLTRHEEDGSVTKRRVCHFQFVSWPDYGVPDSAVSMLHFLQRVREKQAEMLGALEAGEWSGHHLGPPIVVHCSAGIGRTGTFATLDIAIRKFEDIRRVDIRTTVEKIRSQRAFSIQMPDQYVFCHLAFLEYALNMEYVEEVDLTGFDEDCDSE
jgi:tyrosine-protein phosphatase non-receptor type 9